MQNKIGSLGEDELKYYQEFGYKVSFFKLIWKEPIL